MRRGKFPNTFHTPPRLAVNKKTLPKIGIIISALVFLLSVQGIYVTSSLEEETSVIDRVESLPFPRLWKMNWYEPFAFSEEYERVYGVHFDDPDDTALMNTLRIYDLVVNGGIGFRQKDVARKFLYLKELNPNMVLLGQWGTSGDPAEKLEYSLNGDFPFRPQWFTMLVGSTLAQPTAVGDTTITVLPADAEKFYQMSLGNDPDPWNDNIFIQDLRDETKSEMLLLKGRDASTLNIDPKANYDNYDYSQVKFDHEVGTPVWIVHCPNWHKWWGYNLSTQCPLSDVDGLTWGQFRTKRIWEDFQKVRNVDDQVVLDGIHLDSFEDRFYGRYNSFDFVIPHADLNLDTVPDIEEFESESDYIDWTNEIWADGHVDFTRLLREEASNAGQPEIPITHLGWEKSQEYINGQLFENLPMIEYAPEESGNSWVVALNRYKIWMSDAHTLRPKICMMMGGYSLTDQTNYTLMRKSLTFTLMGDAYFTYDGGADWHGYTFWWKDEYSVDSSGRAVAHIDGSPINSVDPIEMDEETYQRLKAGKGYLGMPTSDGYDLGDEDPLNPRYGVLRRDFDNGVVFCNLQNEPVDVEIDPAERLVRIKGAQDKVVNNGQAVVGDLLTLPANDGIILLRQEKFNQIPQLGVIGDKTIFENEHLEFVILATDTDDDILSLTALGLPGNAIFTDNGDNTAVFHWTPTFDQAGEYYISFIADDRKGGVTAETIKITVIDVDITPPVISDVVAANMTYNSAEIIWTTDEPADSKVEYGLDTNYTYAIADSQLAIEHRVPLEVLQYLTTYHYRVISKDAAGNEAVSPDYTFTTDKPPISADLTSELDYAVRGRDITFYAAVTNQSDVSVGTNVWLDDTLPDGSDNPRNPINGEIKTIVLAPGETQNFTFPIFCPEDEPLGLHTTTLKVGQSDEVLFAADSLAVTVGTGLSGKKTYKFRKD